MINNNSFNANRIWYIPDSAATPAITAIQNNTVPGQYEVIFATNHPTIPREIIFTLDDDTASAARMFMKILLRLRITPVSALKIAKRFYWLTKEFPEGNQSENSLSNF